MKKLIDAINILVEESYRSVKSEVEGPGEEVDMKLLIREEAENHLATLLSQGMSRFFA